MRNAESLSQEQIREFLKSSQPIEFAGCGRSEKYAWVERVLRAQNYGELGKRERGADDAVNPGVSRPRGGEGRTLPTALLHHAVHGRGHRAASGSGPGARAVERAGHAPHFKARVRAVWEQRRRGSGRAQ